MKGLQFRRCSEWIASSITHHTSSHWTCGLVSWTNIPKWKRERGHQSACLTLTISCREDDFGVVKRIHNRAYIVKIVNSRHWKKDRRRIEASSSDLIILWFSLSKPPVNSYVSARKWSIKRRKGGIGYRSDFLPVVFRQMDRRRGFDSAYRHSILSSSNTAQCLYGTYTLVVIVYKRGVNAHRMQIAPPIVNNNELDD